MPWRLRFDGINDHCTFPTALSVNLGTDAYVFECRLLLSSLPSSSLYGIVGRSGTATGFAITPDGRLATYSAGSLRYQTDAGLFLTDSVLHTYRLEHDAGGAWRVYRDNLSTPIQSGTFTASTVAASMNRIGTATGSSAFLAGELAYIDLQIPSGSQKWDADLSGGAGTTLPTVSGTNNGTLVNFTVPDCWIFYSSGATYQLTALGGTFSYSGAQASLLRQFKLQTLGATYAYSGAPANLTYVPTGTVYTLTALGGSFAYSGGQASLLRRFRLVANGGVYAYAGGSANLTYNQLPGVYRLTALGATYTYTGGIATLTAIGVTPMANAGAYVIQAYVGGAQTISAKIGGKQTIQAMVAI